MADTTAAAVAAPATAAPTTGTPATGGTPDLKSIPGGGQTTPGKLFDVKVDGKVIQMTEAQLLENASLGKAAFKRMEEATMTKRQAEAFIEKFRRDPMAALEDPALGLTEGQRREAIEKYYQKKYIEQDKLTPEQRKLAEAERELERYRSKEADDKKAAEAKQAEQLQQYWHETYQKAIIETLDKSGLPKTPWTVGRMAFYMQHAAKNKFQAPMEMIAERVREDYQEQMRAFTQNSPAEALVNFLGPDAAKKIQRYALQKHKEKLSQGFAPPERTEAEPTPKPKRKLGGVEASGWKGVNQYWTRRDK